VSGSGDETVVTTVSRGGTSASRIGGSRDKMRKVSSLSWVNEWGKRKCDNESWTVSHVHLKLK
jgi:hypothetical protein